MLSQERTQRDSNTREYIFVCLAVRKEKNKNKNLFFTCMGLRKWVH